MSLTVLNFSLYCNLQLHCSQAEKYSTFVTSFINRHVADPFFLYVPFSHVHTTDPLQPEEQYAGCNFKNTTNRGSFGDALHEVDWIIGNIVDTLVKNNLLENTLILFTGDNGPWMVKGKSGGSTGLLYGRESGYWNVGKGSTLRNVQMFEISVFCSTFHHNSCYYWYTTIV